jgi:hypothetical protein
VIPAHRRGIDILGRLLDPTRSVAHRDLLAGATAEEKQVAAIEVLRALPRRRCRSSTCSIVLINRHYPGIAMLDSESEPRARRTP